MKTYVINLPASSDRRRFQCCQLVRLGLDFEVVRAFRPEDLCQAELAALVQSWERPMLAREVACFLSHRGLWVRIAAGAEPALILEDDALLADAAAAVLAELSQLTGLDRVNLEARGKRKIVCRQPVALGKSHHRVRVFLDRSGAAGYVLWPSGAAKLLKHFNGIAAIADKALCLQQLRADQVEPAVVVATDQAAAFGVHAPPLFHTTINPAGDPIRSASLGTAVRCKLRRIRGEWANLAVRLRHYGDAEKRRIQVAPEHFQPT